MLTTRQPFPKFLSILAVVLVGLSGTTATLAQSVPMLVQAEAMTLVAPMAAGRDIAAMGGRFISATSGTSTTSPVRSASMTVSIPAAGTYYLWARMAGPTINSDALYVGIDSSFDRIFPSAQGPYEWVRVETSNGSGAFGFSLAAGNHDIQVGFGEIGAKLDAVYLTADAGEVPSFAPPLRLAIEAEAMALSAPMTVASEPAANGGQYVSPATGTTSTTPVREASIAVDMPAGTYFLWARMAGPTPTSDALYVGIDTSFARIFPTTAPSGSYEWVKVATTSGGTTFGFTLTAGTHIIQVGHGEIGARLDGVYLTTDANEIPTTAPMRRIIEAESMSLTAPMTVGVDGAANGAQYISPTSGTSTTVPVREASTTVTAPVAGTYYLWARLKGPDINSDALYVGFDNTFIRVFPSATGAYEWVRVEATPGSVNGFTLSSGAHDIQVGHGEIDARLDAVYVTDNANDSPVGAGTPPPSSGFPAACALPNGGYEGYGRNTLKDPTLPPRQVYHVTNLNDSGAGSLRDALSQPNRCVVFDIGGTINVVNTLNVRSNVMIDGFTAPAPGISLMHNGPCLDPQANSDQAALALSSVNNVVIRGIRIRKAPGDGISVLNSSRDIVIDHVSVLAKSPQAACNLPGIRDGAIDVAFGARTVTIQWSIVSGAQLAVLLGGDGSGHVSVHHNLFNNNHDRQPKCGHDLGETPVCDARNNLIWNYGFRGTFVGDNGTGNVVNNYYQTNGSSTEAVNLDRGGIAWVSGNVSQNGFNVNARSNRSGPWPIDPADVPATTDARTAALAVKADAGARGPNFGLDSTDQTIVDGITIP